VEEKRKDIMNQELEAQKGGGSRASQFPAQAGASPKGRF